MLKNGGVILLFLLFLKIWWGWEFFEKLFEIFCRSLLIFFLAGCPISSKESWTDISLYSHSPPLCRKVPRFFSQNVDALLLPKEEKWGLFVLWHIREILKGDFFHFAFVILKIFKVKLLRSYSWILIETIHHASKLMSLALGKFLTLHPLPFFCVTLSIRFLEGDPFKCVTKSWCW